MNLLKETKEILKDNKKNIDDIVWVGTNKYFIDKETFIKLANIDYDDGYGSPKVATNLLIVGDNWWLERHEYDGAEWWEFKKIPLKPEKELNLKALTIEQAKKLNFNVSCGWETLETINNMKDEEK